MLKSLVLILFALAIAAALTLSVHYVFATVVVRKLNTWLH